MNKNKWLLFIQYAKDNPEIIPKNIKERSKIYHDFIDSCKCGSSNNNKICDIMMIKKIKHNKIYSPNKDPLMLQAKIKAYENIVNDKDKELEELYTYIKTLEKINKKVKIIQTV